jgi:hypothetical protein
LVDLNFDMGIWDWAPVFAKIQNYPSKKRKVILILIQALNVPHSAFQKAKARDLNSESPRNEKCNKKRW